MSKHLRILLITYFSLWTAYFIFFWSHAISIDHAGNIVANHINIWGDWAAHFTMGSRMAYDKLLLTQSPFAIGNSFSYPFVADLISAVLIRLGFNFFNAFIIPSFAFSILTIWALFFFYQKIFKSTSIALIASLLFLLNGGTGFIYFFKNILESKDPLLTIINPPQLYTNIEPLFYRWISVIDSMIIPQRAFALGFPLTLIALTLCWSFLVKKNNQIQLKWQKIILPILILGLMPLIHTHSFLAAFIILASWAIGDSWINRLHKNNYKKWLLLAGGVALIAIPIIKIFLYSQISNQFIKWFPGWYSHEYPDQNWLIFWIKNWGLIPLLATLGLTELIKGKNKKLTLITFLPFFVIFILLNLFLFQPFIWDNTKMLVWSSVGFSGLAAHFLISKWNKKRPHPIFAKIFIIILFVFSTLSGSLDAYQILRFKVHSYIMYSKEEVELAKWTKNNTDPKSIWLTGDNHNHWLFNLTGRQALITYRGWLWTHGYKTHQLETDVYKMFEYPQENENLFEQYQVDYIVIGPNEKRVWHADPSQFDQLQLIKASENYAIYKSYSD